MLQTPSASPSITSPAVIGSGFPAVSDIVQTRGLVKVFGKQCVVDHLDLNVPHGAIYGVLGPNGAGKTTTLKMLLGLLRPSGGRVELFGEPWHRAQLGRIGALIESPVMYGHLSGPENLELHAALLGVPKQRIGPVLEQVNLLQAGSKRSAHYSLGMKQRLGLAIALLPSPELLFLDEPANGLDPEGIIEIRALIKSLPAQGITVVVSSHILAEVQHVATHLVVLAEGRMRYQGTLEALLARGCNRLVLKTPDLMTIPADLGQFVPAATLEHGQLSVVMPESEAAQVIANLVTACVRITSLNYRRDDLESLFLGLVSDDPAGRPGVNS